MEVQSQATDRRRRSHTIRSKSSRGLMLKELCIKFSLLNFRNVKRPELARVMTPWVESDDTAPPTCAVGRAIAFEDVHSASGSVGSDIEQQLFKSGRSFTSLRWLHVASSGDVCGKKFVVCSLLALFM